MSKIKEHYHDEISNGLHGGDEDYAYGEYERLEALRKYPHIEATAARSPRDIGYAAGERGIRVPAGDGPFLSWVTAKNMATGVDMTTMEFIAAVELWSRGNREAWSDREMIEREEAKREAEVPLWVAEMYG
jgi:hypothetical protein